MESLCCRCPCWRRNRAGKKVPAIFQRNDAEDLIAVVFPDQLACIENIAGDREVPDHPLVNQTLWDCLHELMDIDGLTHVLAGIETGKIKIIARDLSSPSPMSEEIINAKPYAFLDDTPAEERRTLAIQQRRLNNPREAAEIGRLNPEAIAQVLGEAWPEIRDEDELHDTLVILGFMTEQEGLRSNPNHSHRENLGTLSLFQRLQQCQRATVMQSSASGKLWVAAERLEEMQILLPESVCIPPIKPVIGGLSLDSDTVLQAILRSRLEGFGIVTAPELAQPLGLPVNRIETVLLALEQQGVVLRGQYRLGAQQT